MSDIRESESGNLILSSMNRLGNCHNEYQNFKEHRRVLCLCSAGLLRSPTAALVLANEFNYNTRAAGLETYALIQVDQVLLEWAEEIVVMNAHQRRQVQALLDQMPRGRPSYGKVVKDILVLDIPDEHAYRDPILMSLILGKYEIARGLLSKKPT